MPLTAKLGTTDSRSGNIVPGLGAVKFVAPLTAATPASLVVEVAFPNNPIDLSGYRNTDLYDQPLSYWRMDNATSLIDQAGGGNTMTLDGTPTLVASALSGDANQALSFSGTTQDGVVADAPSLDVTGVFSFEIWVKFAAFPASTVDVFGKLGGYALQVTSAGKLVFTVRNGASTGSVTSATTLSTATWYHVACVYNTANLRLYLNGIQDASSAYSAGIGATPDPLHVARTDNSTTSPGYRDALTASTSGSGTTIGIQTPLGAVAGDYMIGTVSAGATNTISAVPAGWLLIGQTTDGAGMQFVYGKVATSSDAGGGQTYTWTFGTAQSSFRGAIAAFSGVNASSPTGATASALNTGTSISVGITPLYNNTLVFSSFIAQSASGAWTLTPGTKQYEGQNTSVSGETTAVGPSSAQTETGTTATSDNKSVFAVELIGPFGPISYTAVSVDEVSFWNVALTAAQVSAHYAAASVAPTTIVWTDISADVRECRITRGRQYELDVIQAGTATLVVKDTLRNYDPANTLGANAPNVVPLRQIRIRALFNSVYYPLFRGYVERWESKWTPDYVQQYAEIDLSAVDGFEPLSLAAVTGSIPTGLSGSAVGSLLSKANWQPDNRIADSGAFNVAAITMDGSTTILTYIQNVANGEAGLFFIDASGNAVYQDKNHRTTASLSTTSQATFSDVPEGALPYMDLVPSFDKDHITNDWHVTDSGGGDHEASDATSIQKYFRRTQSRSSYLSATDAGTMATYLLGKTKDPGYRFDSIELMPNVTLEVWLQALQREISDRITVHRQPVGIVPGSQIAKDCWIERVEWTMHYGQPWRVRWQLSPAP